MGLGAGEGAWLEESFPLAFHPDHSAPICKVYGSGMESEGKPWINLLKIISFLFGDPVRR